MNNIQDRAAVNRMATYIFVGFSLLIGFLILRQSQWRSDIHIHTLSEAVSMTLALVLGLIALLRYYSKKDNVFLFVGTGFIGTAALDGYHALVTSAYMSDYLQLQSPNEDLIPWSWLTSRVFLAALMVLCAWSFERRSTADQIREGAVYMFAAGSTMACCVFFFYAKLGPAYYSNPFASADSSVFRPQELLPAALLATALVMMLRQANWRTDSFVHWLVLSLIVGIFCQFPYMTFSGRFMATSAQSPFDAMFDAAHVLKTASYGCVLTGMLISTFRSFQQAADSAEQVLLANAALEQANSELATRVSQQEASEERVRQSAEELERMVHTERQARQHVERLIDNIRDAILRLGSACQEILSTTAEQASGAQEQATAVTETVATVEEISQTAEQAAERANMVAQAARQADEVGKTGHQIVDDSISAMGHVKVEVELIAQSISDLVERTKAIGEIIGSVSDIAEQTNVLALNAAVEASRAGEHGKGFSVVAQEVKLLAEQSKKLTTQVRQILGEIRQAMERTINSTKKGTTSASEAEQVVTKAGETIRALADTLAESARLAKQISASANQQASGLVQLNQGIKNIDNVAKRNVVAINQIEEAATRLSGLSHELASLTSHQ